jgi:hypothetical protein
LRCSQAECHRNPPNVQQRDVSLASLDIPKVRAVQARSLSEFLLGHRVTTATARQSISACSDGRPERPEQLWALLHGRTVGT